MAFECGICTAMFNAAQRQPLILECGHTFCRHCILHSLGPQKWCPYCRQPITKHVDDLPRNYALENAMEAANMPLMELMDRWGLANAERMIVKPDQLQLVNLISRKGNTGTLHQAAIAHNCQLAYMTAAAAPKAAAGSVIARQRRAAAA
eukprot:GHUV01058930.1.p1 GENE.GHUV01058930.1~~GHUV01058930.1.p1  ORF type:complete len:169 (+),score=35.46 GHUV01058930.1:62-508(+)